MKNELLESAVDLIAKTTAFSTKGGPSDYEKDGILYCGVCGAPKQTVVEWIGEDGKSFSRTVPAICKCQEAEEEREHERRKKDKFVHLLNTTRAVINPDQNYTRNTFEADEMPNSPISNAVRKYVDHWDEMKRENIGILFYGSKGTGKSFYASCVVNALAEQGVLTGFTSTAILMSLFQKNYDRTEILDAISRFKLLVIDDIGAERDTTYGAETIYSVIDARYRAKMPTIVTTNFDLADMQAETDLWRSRIYDRVIEMCPIPLKMDGVGRRAALADEKRKKARMILSGKVDQSGS